MADLDRYSDIDLDLITHPISGDISIKYNEEAVKSSIKHLVMMGIHQKPFHPEIRSEIHKLLFENFTVITSFEIQKEIEDIIKEHEPRANLVKVTVKEIDRNQISVTIKFQMRGVPSIHTVSLPLERIR